MQTVFEYSMNGTLHGMRYIFESGRNLSASKMIWTVFVISAAIAGIILSIEVILHGDWMIFYPNLYCVFDRFCFLVTL